MRPWSNLAIACSNSTAAGALGGIAGRCVVIGAVAGDHYISVIADGLAV